MRIAIVNDLPLAVEVLRRLVLTVPGYQVAWTAAHGAEAVEQCAKDRPDLVLMDLVMPVMDGVQATAAIMKRSPCAILVVTASVGGNAPKVFEAMGCGALDAVATPAWAAGGKIDGGVELLGEISRVGRLINHGASHVEQSPIPPLPAGALPNMVAIGASTGGPKALSVVLGGLRRSLNAAVTVVQHLDVQFSAGLAEWLDEQTELDVLLAGEGMKPRAGSVFVAGTNDHLVIAADKSFHYTADPVDYPYRPSVDEFFMSLARHWRNPGVAVLMTGMGRDGARGLLELRRAGWRTLAQDEKTSVVYGMPKAAAEMGAAEEIAPLAGIAGAIAKRLLKGS